MKTAIIGSGNIGTDLLIKILRSEGPVQIVAVAGIDPNSDGLQRAARMGVTTTHHGLSGLTELDEYADVDLVFDATSASAHPIHNRELRKHGKRVIDLTPAAIGPFVVPAVNLADEIDSPTMNMVTCGGQATVPIVSAVASVGVVHYAEIVASIASRSAGPGTRANIDEFTKTTTRAIERVGHAKKGKSIIVLNPAEPPVTMRNTVYCLVSGADERAIVDAVEVMVERVNRYVPGYRLKQRVQISTADTGRTGDLLSPADQSTDLLQVSVFLEIVGAAHYLPQYAGNLDIMTSAALQAAEMIAELTPAAKAASA